MGKRKQKLVSEAEPEGHIPVSYQESKAETQWNRTKVAICVVMFGLISWQLDNLEQLSRPILLFMTTHRTQSINIFLKVMGFFGFEFFFILIPITCFAVTLDNNRRKLSFGFDLILLLIYTWLLGSLIKSIFARLRPYQLFVDEIFTPNDMAVLEYSFPSGHSTGSMICWTFLYDRLKLGKSKKQRMLIYIMTWIIVGFASGSRIYFCVHFPHDIIGGWLLSFVLYRLYSDWNVLPSVRALIGLYGLMVLTCFLSTTELLLHMPGLIICTAALSGILVCLIFSKYLPITSPLVNKPMQESPMWKSTLRVILGTIFFALTSLIKVQLGTSILYLYLTGFVMTVWLFWFAPRIFGVLSLY